MTRREYEGPGIVVHWDSDRCIHSRLCVLGAPSVFDFKARPWVHINGTSADEVARVIDTCPSGALSYTRTDGVPNGRRGRADGEDPAESTRSDNDDLPNASLTTLPASSGLAVITPLPDGPLLVMGPIAITGSDGSVTIAERRTLCRCGHSQNKPLCDGSHVRVGFIAAGVVLAASEQSRVET